MSSGVTSQSNRDNNKTKNRVCPAAPSPAGLPLPPRSDRGRDGTEQGMSASASAGVQHQHRSGLVPLASLIKEEARTERRGGAGGSRICARDKDADAGAGVEEEVRPSARCCATGAPRSPRRARTSSCSGRTARVLQPPSPLRTRPLPCSL
jgi:hypothetical protein